MNARDDQAVSGSIEATKECDDRQVRKDVLQS